MLAKEINAILGGGLQTGNGKMPGTTYASDPFSCHTGGKLRSIPGSTCSKCYACRIASFRPSAAKGYASRHAALLAASLDKGELRLAFVAAFTMALRKAQTKHHRFFDAGDLPAKESLEVIRLIAMANPGVKFWLPTREAAWIKGFEAPANLIVRLSSPMIDGKPVPGQAHTSTVHDKAAPIGHECKPTNGACGKCRACWNPNIQNISYRRH